MYNILIVDDEYLARNKIKRILEYKKYDFRIVGDVANGKEAVSFIENHSVDVVFSDVEMPEMDGIELAKHIKKHYPDIKVIIMSNYDNFDYVKQAFKVEVIDYCLKNALSEEVMEEILLQLREDLKKRKTEALGQAAQSDSEYAMKVESAVKGENLSFWPVNSIIIAFQIVDIKVNKQIYSAAEISILYKNIMDLIIQVVKEREGICVFEKDDIIVLYMPFETHVSETEIMNLLNRYIHQIGSSVYKFFNFNILCGISRPTSKKYTLNACFHEAVGMLHTTPVKSKREKKPVWNMTVMPISISQEKTLLGALTNLNLEKVHKCLEEIFQGVDRSNLDVLLGEILSIATKFCIDNKMELPELEGSEKRNMIPSISLEWCKRLFERIIDECVPEQKKTGSSWHVQKAMQYIEQHYTENIGLTELAEYVGVTEQYLSTIFKTVSGQTVSNYLNGYRVMRAKELIKAGECNFKLLYSEVGFSTYSYFFTVFKKHTGVTPENYRKNYLEGKMS